MKGRQLLHLKNFQKEKKFGPILRQKKLPPTLGASFFVSSAVEGREIFFCSKWFSKQKQKNGKINKKFFKKLFWFVKQNKTFIGLKLELTISSDG